MSHSSVQDTSSLYRRFGGREARGQSPLYEQWCLGIADDTEVLALLDGLPRDKRQPNLVLAAARLTGAEESGYEGFRRFLLEHWEPVRRTVLARRTQTNEVGRGALLLPVLAAIHGPISLVEVGASAGLCLFPDRMSHRYDGGPRLDPESGRSQVTLECATSGPVPFPERMPHIVHRAGVDLNPLDVTDTDDVRFLEALIWPGQPDRVTRLRSAIDIVRGDPPAIRKGDLNTHIAELVHDAPGDSTVVVFHTAVLSYLSPEDRRRFQGTVSALPCRWISVEAAGVIDLDAPPPPPPESGPERFVLALDGRAIAWAGPHGQSLDWFAEPDPFTSA